MLVAEMRSRFNYDPGYQPLFNAIGSDTNAMFEMPWYWHMVIGGFAFGMVFMATDPVSAATTPKGRLVYGFGIGLIIYCIRRWGAYADGVAFAVLLMNMAVPLIDQLTRPRIIGHQKKPKRAVDG